MAPELGSKCIAERRGPASRRRGATKNRPRGPKSSVRQAGSSTVSRRSLIGLSWSYGLATRAAHEGSGQRDGQLPSDCRDLVGSVIDFDGGL